MAKTVGSNSFVAHQWASGKSLYARSGAMHCSENIIYSYRTAIAACFLWKPLKADKEEKRFYFVETERFSQTTSSKHMPEVRHAIPISHNTPPVITISKVNDAVRGSYTAYLFTEQLENQVFHVPIWTNFNDQISHTCTYLMEKVSTAQKDISRHNKPNKLAALGRFISAVNRQIHFTTIFKNHPDCTDKPLTLKKLGMTQDELDEMYIVFCNYWLETQRKKDINAKVRAEKEHQLQFERYKESCIEVLSELQSICTPLDSRLQELIDAFVPLKDEFFSDKKYSGDIYTFISKASDIKRTIFAEKQNEDWMTNGYPAARLNAEVMVANWKDGCAVSSSVLNRALNPYEKPYGAPDIMPGLGDLLRVHPERASIVETNRSAEVPLEHVLKAIKFVLNLWRFGKTYQHNEHTFSIGHFQLREVTNEHVIVGCHKFTRQTIEEFASTCPVLG